MGVTLTVLVGESEELKEGVTVDVKDMVGVTLLVRVTVAVGVTVGVTEMVFVTEMVEVKDLVGVGVADAVRVLVRDCELVGLLDGLGARGKDHAEGDGLLEGATLKHCCRKAS